jgi:hypothetical protein
MFKNGLIKNAVELNEKNMHRYPVKGSPLVREARYGRSYSEEQVLSKMCQRLRLPN